MHLSVMHGDIMRQLNGVEAGLAQRITTVEAKQMRLLERVEGVRERLQIPFEYRSGADFGELNGSEGANGNPNGSTDSDSDSETDEGTKEGDGDEDEDEDEDGHGDDGTEPKAIVDAAAAAAATKVAAIATATATATTPSAVPGPRAASSASVSLVVAPVVPPVAVRTLIFAARTDEPLSTPTRWVVAPPHETTEQREHKREVEAAWDAVLVGWEAPPYVKFTLHCTCTALVYPVCSQQHWYSGHCASILTLTSMAHMAHGSDYRRLSCRPPRSTRRARSKLSSLRPPRCPLRASRASTAVKCWQR